jgi:hypothetical protein
LLSIPRSAAIALVVALTRKRAVCSDFVRVSDGTRTRDRLDHNQELYLLSYAHHVPPWATFAI